MKEKKGFKVRTTNEFTPGAGTYNHHEDSTKKKAPHYSIGREELKSLKKQRPTTGPADYY